ncbi:MAG TPA: cytochrome c, partial [Bradyrhizobium sp.]|nr:cytochrome c [Bradyrhizobium sp.]
MRFHPGFSSVVAAAAIAALAFGMAAEPARAQDLPAAKDTIFARKILMGAIDMNMDEIETMLAPEGKLDLAEGQEHAETISTMLMAFPHMFPPATNQWKAGAERDPATDTFASPDVWKNFTDFYARATEASKIAWSASRARRPDEFRGFIVQLR